MCISNQKPPTLILQLRRSLYWKRNDHLSFLPNTLLIIIIGIMITDSIIKLLYR